jgi:uncharacterized protein
VNPNRYPLRINVGFLLNQPIGYSREIHFDCPEFKLDEDFHVRNLTGLARVNRTPQGILLQGEFDAQTDVDCVRCLNSMAYSLHTSFDELYAFTDRSVTESGLLLPEDGTIDLAPLAREYLLLEIPISPVCRPECKGLCPVCGEDLNLSVCEHTVSTA